ncbi:hypothetical protein L195_g057964, partial [Trifolium pratense]
GTTPLRWMYCCSTDDCRPSHLLSSCIKKLKIKTDSPQPTTVSMASSSQPNNNDGDDQITTVQTSPHCEHETVISPLRDNDKQRLSLQSESIQATFNCENAT